MPDNDPARPADLEKARVILGEYGLLIGPAGEMSETIAQAVADGIALGRKEGLHQGFHEGLVAAAKGTAPPKGPRGG